VKTGSWYIDTAHRNIREAGAMLGDIKSKGKQLEDLEQVYQRIMFALEQLDSLPVMDNAKAN
jgi:hypothetical protein